MATVKISKISIVKEGRVLADLDNGKKLLLDRESILTAQLLGITLKTGSEISVGDSVDQVTGEVNDTWARLEI